MAKKTHDIFSIEEIPELRGEGKRYHKISEGDIVCRIVKFPRDYLIADHYHTGKLTWKYLIKGKIRYDEDDLLGEGQIATVHSSKGNYSGVAEEESYLLLIEKASSRIVRPGDNKMSFGERYHEIVSNSLSRIRYVLRVSQWYLRIGSRAAIIMFLLVAAGVLLMSYDNGTFGLKEFDFAAVGASLIASTAFFWAATLSMKFYQDRAVQRFEKFDLERFCEKLKSVRKKAIIYSTYSNLFIEEYFWYDFKNSIRSRYHTAKEAPFKIEIMLLNPFSFAAQQRDRERTGENIPMRIIENIRNLESFIFSEFDGELDTKEILEVRITDSMPRHQHHQIDEEVNFGYYPKKKAASTSSYLRCASWSEVGRFAIDAFESVWEPTKRNDEFETLTIREFLDKYQRELAQSEQDGAVNVASRRD